MAAMDHRHVEIGVDLKARLKTSPRRLMKALTAGPESNDALTIGYLTMTSAH